MIQQDTSTIIYRFHFMVVFIWFVFILLPLQSAIAQDFDWTWEQLPLSAGDGDSLLIKDAKPAKVEGAPGLFFVTGRDDGGLRMVRDVDETEDFHWEYDDSCFSFIGATSLMSWTVTGTDSLLWFAYLTQPQQYHVILRSYTCNVYAEEIEWTEVINTELVYDDSRSKSVSLGDLNGDGSMDYIITTTMYGDLHRYLSDPDNQTLTELSVVEINDSEQHSTCANLGDLDGDGDLEYVLTYTRSDGDEYGGDVSTYQNMTIYEGLDQDEPDEMSVTGLFHSMQNFGFVQLDEDANDEMVAFDGVAWTTWNIEREGNDWDFSYDCMISTPSQVLSVWQDSETGEIAEFLTATKWYSGHWILEDYIFSSITEYYSILSWVYDSETHRITYINNLDSHTAVSIHPPGGGFRNSSQLRMQAIGATADNAQEKAISISLMMGGGETSDETLSKLWVYSTDDDVTWQNESLYNRNTSTTNLYLGYVAADITSGEMYDVLTLDDDTLTISQYTDGEWNDYFTIATGYTYHIQTGDFNADDVPDFYIFGDDEIWLSSDEWTEDAPQWYPVSAFQDIGQHPGFREVLTVFDYQLDGDADLLLTNGRVLVNNSILSRPEEEIRVQPDEFILVETWPNPFNSVLHVRYEMPVTHGTIKVFDVLGREVMDTMTIRNASGEGKIQLDASSFAAGVYFIQLQAGQQRAVKRVVYLK